MALLEANERQSSKKDWLLMETNSTNSCLGVMKELRRYDFQYRGPIIVSIDVTDEYDCSLELVTLTPKRLGCLKW